MTSRARERSAPRCSTRVHRPRARGDGLARVGFGDVTVWLGGSTARLQLFTGDPLPDVARRSLAVEPMTCPANAFRTGEAVIRLEPGGPQCGSAPRACRDDQSRARARRPRPRGRALGAVGDEQHRLAAAAAKTSSTRACAVGGSRCAVGSSSTSTGASMSRARARTTRWRWPPESSRPCSPTRVSAPSGSEATQSQIAGAPQRALDVGVARLGTPQAHVGGDRGREQVRVLPGHRNRGPDVLLAVAAEVAPASVTRPASGSRKRSRRLATVVLPAPLGPSSATVRPGRSRRLKPSSPAARSRGARTSSSATVNGAAGAREPGRAGRRRRHAVGDLQDPPAGRERRGSSRTAWGSGCTASNVASASRASIAISVRSTSAPRSPPRARRRRSRPVTRTRSPSPVPSASAARRATRTRSRSAARRAVQPRRRRRRRRPARRCPSRSLDQLGRQRAAGGRRLRRRRGVRAGTSGGTRHAGGEQPGRQDHARPPAGTPRSTPTATAPRASATSGGETPRRCRFCSASTSATKRASRSPWR